MANENVPKNNPPPKENPKPSSGDKLTKTNSPPKPSGGMIKTEGLKTPKK